MAFVPACSLLGPETAPKFAFVLHGIFGAGHNFRSFIKRLLQARPDYRFGLVDLRLHGRSQGAPPPHTLAACAEDLHALAEELGVRARAVIGHSFGGKVALKYAERGVAAPEQIWALDSNPGRQQPDENHEVLRVLSALEQVELPAASRQAVVDSLMAKGLSSGTAHWLTTNLQRDGDRYRWQFDLKALRLLLQDYFKTDLWPFIEKPKSAPKIALVIAEQSDRFDPNLRARAQALPSDTCVQSYLLANSGHWMHVDNPDGLLSLLERGLV